MTINFNGSNSSYRSIAGLAIGAAVLFAATPASALTINATYGNTGGGNFSAAQIADINSVISLYQSTFTDNMTVNITFNNMNSGLGQSQTSFYGVNYGDYHSALIGDAKSSDDTAALAKLASSAPVSDTTQIAASEANLKALGFTGFGAGQDSVIGLNAGICYSTHSSPVAGQYDLFAVACHELDEALGTVSFVGSSQLSAADLFRYGGTSAGVLSGRSFTTSTSANAFFSIDGVTALDQYNQNGQGDYGDWVVHNPNQVQDWAGTTGHSADPNIELRLLDVVGYNRAAVPEPATVAALGLGFLLIVRRRRK